MTYKTDCPKCIGDGYYDTHCAYCDDNLPKEIAFPKNLKLKPRNSADAAGSATELSKLEGCMERGFKALHLEVAPTIVNDLRNTVYAVLNHLKDNK